jgi:hypothetical protein
LAHLHIKWKIVEITTPTKFIVYRGECYHLVDATTTKISAAKKTENLNLPGQASKERSLSHLLPKEQPEVINQNNLVTFQSHDHK